MFRKDDVVEKKYKVLRKIGSGGFGNVYHAQSLSSPSEQFALKVLENMNMNEEEVKVGLAFDSPYLVKFKEILNRKEGVIIVMEYCDGGDLAARIEQKKPPTEAEIYKLLHDSSMALKLLHDAGIVHRDIKPSNFFLVKGGFKLGDYGTVRLYQSACTKSLTCIGSNGYISPEILLGKRSYTMKVDIFSLGVTLMEFILGYNPFCNSGENVNILMVASGTPVEAAIRHPHPVMALARRMIAVDPASRPDIDEVLAFPVPASAMTAALSSPPPSSSVSTSFSTSSSASSSVSVAEGEKENESAISGNWSELTAERDALKAEMETLKAEKETLLRKAQYGKRPPCPSCHSTLHLMDKMRVFATRSCSICRTEVPRSSGDHADYPWRCTNCSKTFCYECCHK